MEKRRALSIALGAATVIASVVLLGSWLLPAGPAGVDPRPAAPPRHPAARPLPRLTVAIPIDPVEIAGQDDALERPTDQLLELARSAEEPAQKQEILLELRSRRTGLATMTRWLADPDREVRMVAAESLELTAGRAERPALERALATEKDGETRTTLEAALAAVNERLAAQPR
jgi:hypothetical protein